MIRRWPSTLAALLTLLLPVLGAAQMGEHADIELYATASPGGTLATDYDFAAENPVSQTFCAGGLCLFSSTDPGFTTGTTAAGALVPLATGTEVALELVALDPGVSVKVGGQVLDGLGDSASLGTAPGLHLHPEWQVTRPEGERGTYAVSFRLRQLAGGASYGDSPTYTLRLTNGAPSPTPTPIPTATPAPTGGPLPPELVLDEPRARGDQLVFYFDARDGYTTFLNLANEGDVALDVTLELYGAALATPLVLDVPLAAGATRTIDVGSLRADGLGAGPGLAVACARDAAGDAVTSRALAGSFTVANLRTESGWGGPAAARLARLRSAPATLPPTGTPIDGTDVVLEQIRPTRLDLAVYYDPDTLAPAADGGNQVVLASFADLPGTAGDVAAATTEWNVDATRSDGSALASRRHVTRGVEVTDLATFLATAVGGSAGGVVLRSTAGGAPNRLAFFVESLGTFATGYRLPAVVPAVPGALAEPAARGDQLVLYYDARPGFTTFLNVANRGGAELAVRVALHGASALPYDVPIVLAAGASRTLDVGALVADGLVAEPGIALVTAVRDGGPVTSGGLAGSFTVANLATLSAWGGPAAARSAFPAAGDAPPGGTPIDGAAVVLQALAPPLLDLAVYYDPATLAPPEEGGNQVVLLSFDDAPEAGAAFASTTWRVVATRGDGAAIADRMHATAGVEVTDLATLAGAGVDGAAGRLWLEPAPGGARNRVVLFAESLGTFATGYRLPVPSLSSGG